MACLDICWSKLPFELFWRCNWELPIILISWYCVFFATAFIYLFTGSFSVTYIDDILLCCFDNCAFKPFTDYCFSLTCSKLSPPKPWPPLLPVDLKPISWSRTNKCWDFRSTFYWFIDSYANYWTIWIYWCFYLS